MTFIADDLEKKCRRTARNLKKRPSDTAPEAYVAREIALTLDHIDSIREQLRDRRFRMRQKELFIDSQIINIDKRVDLLPDWLERTHLKNEFSRMLDRVEVRLQRTMADNESVQRQLQVRLLELMNMHEQLSLENGNTEDSS